MNTFKIEKINNSVWVFKNALNETQDIIDHFINNNQWLNWYTHGTMARIPSFKFQFDNFPTNEEWANKKNIAVNKNKIENNYFENKINDLFYETTKLYIEANNINYSNWIYREWNIAKYIENSNSEYTMMHHTDFQRDISYSQGEKIIISAIFYLNDNYEGGDVEFRFLDDNDINIVKGNYSYKPNAGDILVFTSGHPHYHGVKSITKGEKYIIRTYWTYYDTGHPLWNKLKEKYGEETWLQMEEERMLFNRKPENKIKINDIFFWVPFEEYYKKEIENLNL